MAFPDEPTDLAVSFAFDADLSADPDTWVYDTDASEAAEPIVVIQRGRIGEQPEVQPTQVQLAVRNEDGEFSPRNVNGPNYGRLRRNTPVQATVDVGSGPAIRGTAQVPDWPVERTGPGIDQRVPLSTSGVLRRLGQGDDPASPMRRTILGANNETLIAYWPLEGGPASGMPLGAPMTADGTVTFDAVAPAGSLSVANLTGGGVLSGAPPAVVALTTGMSFEALAIMAPGTSTTESFEPIRVVTASAQWALILSSDLDVIRVTAVRDPDNADIPIDFSVAPDDGLWHHYRVTITRSGDDLEVEAWRDGVSLGSDTVLNLALSPVNTVIVNYLPPDPDDVQIAAGHVAVYATGALDDHSDALDGYAGELASDRVNRLFAEEGLFVDVAAGDSEAMGPQPLGTFTAAVQDCEDVDRGFLVERLNGAPGFDPHTAYENQPVALTLDYELGHIMTWEPVDDEGPIVNRMTVTREGGRSSTVERVDGPLGSDPLTGAGPYPLAETRNVATDEQTLQHAGHAVGHGTVDKMRFRNVKVDLVAHPELIDDWLACDIGSRVLAANAPAEDYGPDDLDLILRGYVEVLDGAPTWEIYLDLGPCEAYRVGELAEPTADAGEFVGRLAEDLDAAIRVAIDADDLTILIDPNAFRWSAVADDFNPDLRVRFGGETADVSSIAAVAATSVGRGALASADNAAVSPATTGFGAADGDLLLCVGRIRGTTGSLTATAGWDLMGQVGRLYVWGRRRSGTTPITVTPTGGAAGDVVSATVLAFHNMPLTVDPVVMVLKDPVSQVNSTAQNIAYPGAQPHPYPGSIVLLVAGKSDDWTSVAVPSGFTESGEPSTTTGNDQAIYIAFQIQTTPTLVPAGTLVVTGGATAVSEAMMLVLAAGYQSLTVSARSVNGAVKSHAAGTPIGADNPFVLAL